MKFRFTKMRLSLSLAGILITAFILLLRATSSVPVTVHTKALTAAAPNSYDVVVIGSEIQGVLLAREARALGLNVLILDPRSKPGGELVQAQMFFLDDVNDNKHKSLVQGEIKRLFKKYKAGKIRKTADFQAYYDKISTGIPIKSGIVIDSLNTLSGTNNKTLKSMTFHTKDEASLTIQSKYWVENTDFSALTGRLGCRRIPGMESLYKGKQPHYMAATYMLKFRKVDWKKLHKTVLKHYPLTNVRKKYGPNTYVDKRFATGFSYITKNYTSLDKQLSLRGLNAFHQKNGQVIINGLLLYDVNPSDPKSVHSAITKARIEAPGILAFLRKNMPGFARAELNGFPEYLYIRDYNRYETEYVLDYPDVMGSRMFWDNVSIGGYAIDLQGTSVMPKGIDFGKPDRYGLPLRSFELKSYTNVLVVGKNVGAAIKAYGSARIMPTTALAAQTIGIILGHEKNKLLMELNENDFKRIHNYLKKDYKIILQQ
ncbi:FAD-dependent oxidoreductase [Paenibacillus sp. BR2-3]|uniref:FAD-dependent oxidoreductase n=1 Tax=Paenibacillus sp. BR2-3 TaxID=3048494 RepID=UPI003977B685